MEQLGPFHLFFTLSCAEMRWPSVLAEVFRTIGNGKIKIHYPKNWEGEAEQITIQQVNEHGHLEEINGKWEQTLPAYQKWYLEQNKISMTDFLKDHFILITRIFDKRVKDFITEVMKKKGIVNYCYRVEFQMRGLPHIHGVAWLNPEEIKDCLDVNGLFREDKDGEKHLIKLVDKWISCNLKFGHVDQNQEIKNLNNQIQNFKKDLKALLDEIHQLNKDHKNLHDEKIALSEEYKELSSQLERDLQKLNLKELKEQMKIFRNEKKSKHEEFKKIEKEIKDHHVEKNERQLNQLVREVNMHHCTRSCRKYHKEKCRYDFPRLFSQETIISNPLPSDTKNEDVVKKILEKRSEIIKLVKEGYKQLDEIETKFDTCPERFLEEICGLNVKEHGFSSDDPDNILKIDNPNDIMEIYNKALSVSEKGGRSVILKRKISERNVNNYNPLFHSIWQANTDIQLCLDTHAVISYISDYMTKSDQGLTKLLVAALNEKKNASRFEQLNHVKRIYFSHKQTCVSEAAYRLLPSLDLKGSNIKTLFLSSGFPENRNAYFRQITEEENQDGGIEIEGRDGRFQYPTSKTDIYNARPNDSESKYTDGRLENLCYAEFCIKYDKVAEKSVKFEKYEFEEFTNDKGEVVHGIGYEANRQNEYPLEGLPKYFFFHYNGKRIYMVLRANPYILRIYSGKRKDPIEETYSELLLFTSWRDEKKSFYNDDPHFREKIREMFKKVDEISTENEDIDDSILKDIKRKGSELQENRQKIYPHSQKIEELRELLEKGDFVNLGDGIDPAAEQQDSDDEENQEEFQEMEDESHQESSSSKKRSKAGSLKEEKCVHKIPDVEDTQTMKRSVRALSFEQRVVFDKFINFSKSVMCVVRYGGNIDTTPPKLIVHGGGGVGKSYLIKLLSQWVHKILSSWGDITEYPKLIRLAFTGAAAYLIGNLDLFLFSK